MDSLYQGQASHYAYRCIHCSANGDMGLAGGPTEHLLIWHMNVPSLARRGMNASEEMHRLLSSHGRIAGLETYLSLRAAAVSFVRVQDAQKVRGQPSWQRWPLHKPGRHLYCISSGMEAPIPLLTIYAVVHQQHMSICKSRNILCRRCMR